MDTYEKKYKGALARCKWLLSNGMISKIAATDMFRELMDNDENIRKEIINIFHSLAEGKIPVDINYADIFTWLEKQGEQKPTWSEEEEHYIRQLESMVREKWALAEKAQDEEAIKNMSNLAFFLKTLNPNKKPSDEEMKTLLRTEYEKGRADAFAQMQKEWSEEDEVKINRIVACLENLNVADNDILLKDVDWLKSLKQRIGWKPSDEQMEALFVLLPTVSYGRNPAFSLYNDLKKLKGE